MATLIASMAEQFRSGTNYPRDYLRYVTILRLRIHGFAQRTAGYLLAATDASIGILTSRSLKYLLYS